MEYTGTGDRIPNAPPLPQAQGKALPQKWVPAAEGVYTAAQLYSHIPAIPQATLIGQLEALFTQHEIPLLGAVFDRFDADNYADQLDQPIALDAHDPDDDVKHLTLPMVLHRLNAVMENRGGATIEWGVSTIDRNLNGQGAQLTLPSRITTANGNCRFHMEVLNDLVNPRGGHGVLPEAYFPAISKAIALSAAGTAGQTSQGPNEAYYFWSATRNRGINVVVKSRNQILTVYYCNAVAAWWNGGLSAQLRLERTV
jgi:hypothetical protein